MAPREAVKDVEHDNYSNEWQYIMIWRSLLTLPIDIVVRVVVVAVVDDDDDDAQKIYDIILISIILVTITITQQNLTLVRLGEGIRRPSDTGQG